MVANNKATKTKIPKLDSPVRLRDTMKLIKASINIKYFNTNFRKQANKAMKYILLTVRYPYENITRLDVAVNNTDCMDVCDGYQLINARARVSHVNKSDKKLITSIQICQKTIKLE